MSKKSILSGFFAIALVIVAGLGVNMSVNNDVKLTLLALNDIEALAQTSGEDVVITCGARQGVCWYIATEYIPIYYHCEFSGLQRDYCIDL